MDEINSVIADKNPTTQNSYRQDYKRLLKLLNVNSIIVNNQLSKPINTMIKDIKNAVNEKTQEPFSNHTKKNLFSMLIMVLKENSKFKSRTTKLHNERKKILDKIDTERKDKNKVLVEVLPEQKTINQQLNDLYNKGEFLKYIVNYLVITLSLRNKDLCLKIVSSMDKTQDKEFNYLVIRDKDIMFIRNVYKTAKKYGQKINKIVSKKFRDALLNYLESQNVDYKNEDHVLFKYSYKDRAGEPMSCDKIGERLRYLLIINETNLNKIKVKDINNKPNTIKALNIMEKNRGTNKDTISKYYSIEN